MSRLIVSALTAVAVSAGLSAPTLDGALDLENAVSTSVARLVGQNDADIRRRMESGDLVVMEGPDFDDSERGSAHPVNTKSYYGFGRWQCNTTHKKRCSLPPYAECFLAYVTRDSHCDILWNGSRSVMISATTGNCGARCFRRYRPPVGMAADAPVRRLLTTPGKGLSMDVIEGPTFDDSARGNSHPVDTKSYFGFGRWQCNTTGKKRCSLPPYAECFLTYVTKDSHCDVLWNGSRNVMISSKQGNCGVRCFK